MKRLMTGIRVLLVLMLISSCPVTSAAERSANRCPAYLPEDAVATGAPRLCRLVGGGEHALAVCHEFVARSQHYQVISRGGTSPYAVREITAAEAGHEIILAEDLRKVSDNRSCEPERPVDVPDSAIHRGTGVCEDEQGRPLPCSVYEYAGPRDPITKRYFVYYAPEGRGVLRVDVMPAGDNGSALEAELAYQLARALFATGCCQPQAWEYAAHATALFPGDTLYHDAHEAPPMPAMPPAALSESGCRPAGVVTLNPAP